MGVNGLTIMEGATCSATGGTSKTFVANGATVKGGIQVVDTSQTDARIRPSITAVAKSAVMAKDGSWSPEKRDVVIVRPKILADGSVFFNSQRIITSFHPETTVAEVNELYNDGAQLNFDADLSNYRLIGTIA